MKREQDLVTEKPPETAGLSPFARLSPSGAHLQTYVTARLLRHWYETPDPFRPCGIFRPFSIFSHLYRILQRRDMLRASRHRKHLPAYVISIGNLVAGGTGKTPLTIWLARYLRNLGLRVAVLSRGYGGRVEGVSRVPKQGNTCLQAGMFGDEPVLISRKLEEIPVWVARQRWRAGLEAIRSDEAEVVLLDDGFQHYALHRDLDLVLLDSRYPFGNGSLLPLGPLREPVEHLQRADAIILTRAEEHEEALEARRAIQKLFSDKPIFCCNHFLSGFRFGLDSAALPSRLLHNRRAVAFAGIAHPNRFFSSIAGTGIAVAQQFAFPDHYRYTPRDLLRLLKSLAVAKADLLITTEKDAVRLPGEIRPLVLTAQLELDFGSDQERLENFLLNRIREASGYCSKFR